MADSNVAKVQPKLVNERLKTAELLFRRAEAMGLRPSWVTPGGLFAVEVDGRERYVNAARSALNSHTSISLATNKYLTRQIIDRNNMANIPFVRTHNHLEAMSFLGEHGKIIAKPISGSGSRDIHVITTFDELKMLDVHKYILEKYIAGDEMRYLVLNGSVIGVHRSDYGESVEQDRALRRISYPDSKWDTELMAQAIALANALDLRFAAVDFIIDDSGTAHILEINTAPGLKWFHAPSEGPVVDVAGKFLSAVFDKETPTGFDSTPSADRKESEDAVEVV